MDWLEEELGSYDDDYLIIDCPGILSLPRFCGYSAHKLQRMYAPNRPD